MNNVVLVVPCARGPGQTNADGHSLKEEADVPTYEYKCRQCKKTFTDKQTFQEHDQRKQAKCPKCDSADVQQVISRIFAKTSKKS